MISKKPNLLKQLVSCSVLLLSLPVLGLAAGVEQLGPFTSPTDQNSGTYTFNVPTFNPSLGTLNEVYLSLTYSSTAYLQVLNTTSTAQSFSNATSTMGSAQANLTYQTTTGSEVLNVKTFPSTAGPASGSVAANGSTTIAGTADSETGNILVLNPGTAFEGTGGSTVPLSLSLLGGSGSYTGTANAGVFFGGGDDLVATLTVDYLYCDCVPEPSTWGMVAMSLGLLFVTRRLWIKRSSVA